MSRSRRALLLVVHELKRGEPHTNEVEVWAEPPYDRSPVEGSLTFMLPDHEAPPLGQELRVLVEWGDLDDPGDR